MRRNRTVLILLAMLVGALAVFPAGAQTNDNGLPTFQHSAKFICGPSNGDVLAEGEYRTAINVHNPNLSAVRGNEITKGGPSDSQTFSPTFRKKAVLLYPRGDEPAETPQRPGPWFRPPALRSDWGFEIDCLDIRSELLGGGEGGSNDVFIKGFVVIEARGKLPLDVVAAYTVEREEALGGGFVTGSTIAISEDIETVQPKRIRSG